MKIIDGRKINAEIGEELKAKIDILGKTPKLGILCVGEERASLSFINVKKKFGEKYGFEVNLYKMSENVSVNDIIENIKKIEEENNAVILQLPLPEQFKADTQNILDIINVQKDVDNLTGKNFYESPIIISLKKVLPEKFEKVAIVGMGKVVGQPVKAYCEQNSIEFVEVGADDFDKIKEGDVVVSAVGIPKLIKKEHIKPGSTLIDYGCSYFDNDLFGDFDESCYEVAHKYTPVPGGMGPIVVACLFENVLQTL